MSVKQAVRSDGAFPAPKPPDEANRVAALHDLCILDSGKDQRFDRITKLVAELLNVPIVLVSLVDESREWFKSTIGTEIVEIDRGLGFCAHGILQRGNAAFTVTDALIDPTFATHPFVLAGPKLRFYSGAPLISADGQKIGMLCVHDVIPRPDFDDKQKTLLMHFAQIVMDEINFHRTEHEHKLLIGELSHRVKNLYSTISSIARMSIKTDQSAAQYVKEFNDRIVAMAAAHDHLIENRKGGADLLEIVQSIVSSHQNIDETRFVFDIKKITINSVLIQSFALCIHELLTNSIKYGALKDSGGQVQLSCRRTTESKVFRDLFVWRETGGKPPVTPSHRGFGHRMLESTMRGSGGAIKFDWQPEGLVCEFELVTQRKKTDV